MPSSPAPRIKKKACVRFWLRYCIELRVRVAKSIGEKSWWSPFLKLEDSEVAHRLPGGLEGG